ncbi:MAG: hypothetical protein VKJ64_22405, partial [Leptolyngbyaceae bacterium]|nr:hypothetical protein [Leptolyngbyaceae bacterium]
MSNRFPDHHPASIPHHRAAAFASAPHSPPLNGATHRHQTPTSSSPATAEAWVNQVQLSLAILDPRQLRSMLLQAAPPPIADHRLGQVNLKMAVPLAAGLTADGILRVEVISCRLADEETIPPLETTTSRCHRHRAMVNQIRCETKLHNLGLNLTLTEAIARLQYALFSSGDIQRILHLPYHGWHRSWWEMVDPSHEFSLPFQRLMRSRRYADGTVSLQYKDQFSYLPPPCFRSHSETALFHIQRPGTPFATTLAQMNRSCETLGLDHAILIYRHLTKPEYEAFQHQGVRLYHWSGDRPSPPQAEHRPMALLPMTVAPPAPTV